MITKIWHLVTNHQNMLYILAAGMVMSPAGFKGKYYSDSLNYYPGRIPLFPNRKGNTAHIPPDVLRHVISEKSHLVPCIASFTLTDLPDSTYMRSQQGKIRNPTKNLRKDDIAALITAPLPISLLLEISFRSPEDKQVFEAAASNVSNVDSSFYQIKVAESLFSSNHDLAWTPTSPQERKLFKTSNNIPAFELALGGVLAMLYHIANRSDLGLKIFRLATEAVSDNENKPTNEKEDPILAELPNWMSGNKVSQQADTPVRLFWGVIQSLIDAQAPAHSQPPIDVVLAYLEKQLDKLEEAKFISPLQRLITDMRSVLGLGGGTITELLERHKGSLSRPLLLFCLREHCTDLLEFSHSLLSDAEYILAGILFGVRDGWLNLPKEMRPPSLSHYVAFRMADAQQESLAMSAPPHPRPLRELFTLPSNKWDRVTLDAAVELASKCDWNRCLRTKVTLAETPGGSQLPKSFERHGLHIVLPGKVTANTEVDEELFLDHLGQWPPIDRDIESAVREKLVHAIEKNSTDYGNQKV